MKDLSNVCKLFPYIKKRVYVFAGILILSLFSAFLGLLPIQFIGAIVDIATTGTSDLTNLFPWLNNNPISYVIMFAVILTLKYGADTVYGGLVTVYTNRIIMDVRNDAFVWAMQSHAPYKETRKDGDIISRVVNDVEAITRALAGPLNGLLPTLLRLIGALAILFCWNIKIGLIEILLIPPLYLASQSISRKAKKIAVLQREAQGELTSVLSDVLYGIPVIKAYQAEKREYNLFKPKSNEMYSLAMQNQKYYCIYWIVTYLLIVIGVVAAVYFITVDSIRGRISAGSIAIAYSYVSNVLMPVVSLSRYGNDLYQADAALKRVFELKSDEDSTDSSVSIGKPASELLPSAPTVAFQDATIAINENYQLRHIHFTAHPNEIVVLAGDSGQGKSTILQALIGNQRLEQGKIRINSTDATLTMREYLPYFGVTFQDSIILDRSLRENIAFTDGRPSDERLQDLAHKLMFEDVIREKGYDSPLGAKGSKLSGGQKKKIAIARAIYMPKKVYIFDEPTSELDDVSRQAVISLLLELKKEATIIVSSHDAELMEAADQVIQIQKTEVSEYQNTFEN